MTIEYRFAERKLVAGDEGKLSGRAASYNSVTDIGDPKTWGFREQIAPGAFKKSLAKRDIVLLDQHNHEKPLARTSAGTLEIRDTDEGIDFEATPSDTTYGRDALATAAAKNYGGCSFGFEVTRDSWKRGENGAPDERTLEEVVLHEISTVTFPAYGDTNVNARDSYAAARESREAALGPIDGDQERGGDAPGNGKKPYGNVTYADPKNGKYPVDTLKHVKAAWAYINKPKNAAKYPLNGVSLASVKAKIKAAMKKFGVGASESDSTLTYDAAELRELVNEVLQGGEYRFEDVRELLSDVREFLSRDEDSEEADAYDDDFYEDDDAEADDTDRSERDAKDGDPQNKGANDNGKDQSDAKAGDKGKAANNCNTCDGKGKDKSGNKCAACGGSGHKNGDGQKHESGKGDEDTDGKSKQSEQNNQKTSEQTPEGETGNPARSDQDRRDVFMRLRAKARKERMERELA